MKYPLSGIVVVVFFSVSSVSPADMLQKDSYEDKSAGSDMLAFSLKPKSHHSDIANLAAHEEGRKKAQVSASAMAMLHSKIEPVVESVSFDFSFGLTQRTDALSWSIASDISGTRSPNTLSELDYNSLQINGLELQLEMGFGGGILNGSYLQGRVHKGSITDGVTLDSDFNGDNKTKEYSRSKAENTGDFVSDYSLAWAYPVFQGRWFKGLALSGYSLHQQFLRKQNAVQLLPSAQSADGNSSYGGLNSTYQSEWQGPWVGLAGEWHFQGHFLVFRSEYHKAYYHAEADWNLREAFMHPKSFEHKAEGDGVVMDLAYAYDVRFQEDVTLTLGVAYRIDAWEALDGLDTLYLSSGEVVSTRLNKVEWGAESVSVSIKFVR